MMDQTEQLVKTGIAYIEAVNKLKENCPEDVQYIQSILNCVRPEPDYHLGIFIEEPPHFGSVTHRCDQSWFHCYQGNVQPIMRRPYDSRNTLDCDNDNMLYLRCTFGLFNHLIIEPSEMGAWQAYLLAVSKTIIPFSGKLYYTKRKIIFCHEQLHEMCSSYPDEYVGLCDLDVDLSPKVSLLEKEADISCCFWTDWGGLIREDVKIKFTDDNKVNIGIFNHNKLFDYDIGIRY